MKYFAACLLCVCVCLCVPASFVYAIDVRLNGEKIFMEVSPALQNNRTMISISAVASALGGDARWDKESKEVVVSRGSTSVVLKMGSSSASVNGSRVDLDAPPVIYNGRTMVPLSFIATAFGEKVRWDAQTQTVFLGSALSSPEEIAADPSAQALVSFMTAFRRQSFDPFSLGIDPSDAALLPNLTSLEYENRSVLVSQLTSITYQILTVAPRDSGSDLYLRLHFSDLGGMFFETLLSSQDRFLEWNSLDAAQQKTLLSSLETAAVSSAASSTKKVYADVKVSMLRDKDSYRVDLKNSPAFCNALWGNLLSYYK